MTWMVLTAREKTKSFHTKTIGWTQNAHNIVLELYAFILPQGIHGWWLKSNLIMATEGKECKLNEMPSRVLKGSNFFQHELWLRKFMYIYGVSITWFNNNFTHSSLILNKIKPKLFICQALFSLRVFWVTLVKYLY